MYEIALIENDDNSIDIIASNHGKKQHFILDVVSQSDGDYFQLCKDMLNDEPAVYRTHFSFKTWQLAKKHYDRVKRKGFNFNYQKDYF